VARLTVEEASASYESAMRNVLPGGDGVCAICKTFINPAYAVCIPCERQPDHLDAVAPITYSEHLGQLHTALRGYKDGFYPQVRRYAMVRLAAILWRFLERHEECVASAAGVASFDAVTTVPSSMPADDEARSGLRTMVGWCVPVRERFGRLLRATGDVPSSRAYDPRRYACDEPLVGAAVLLIDDTWTGGGHAQSAAHALRDAGASGIGLVAIGRHVQPDWDIGDGTTSGERLAELPRRFDWDRCAVHG
jgi:predicted amidophosphoribosyltransferase